MKKTLKLASLALAAMALMVACKNAPEATEDTVAIDTTPIEEVVEDTLPAIDTVAPVETAKPVAKATTKKKADKADNATKTTDETGFTVRKVEQKADVNKVKMKANTEKAERIKLN